MHCSRSPINHSRFVPGAGRRAALGSLRAWGLVLGLVLVPGSGLLAHSQGTAGQAAAEPLQSEGPVYGWATSGLGAELRELPPELVPAELAPVLWPHSLEDPAWTRDPAAPWAAWVDALLAAAGGAESGTTSDSARAQLAALALARDDAPTAWQHLQAIRSTPALRAALVPRFLPGLSAEFPGTAGGLPPDLPAGVELRPSLPPPGAEDVPAGWLEPRSASVRGLTIGGATVDMAVELRTDGVDVRFDWRAGPPTSFRCRIPCPAGLARGSEYADWTKAQELGSLLPVELGPDATEWRLWLRFKPQRKTLPDALPDPLPTLLREAGLALVLPADPPPGLRGLAPALERLLGLPVRALGPDSPLLPADGPNPVAIDLLPPETRARKLADLMTLIERFLLSR